MGLTKNEAIALNYIADRTADHVNVAPKGLTMSQYRVAVDTIHKKGYIRAAFQEGHELVAVKLLYTGEAALDDYNQERKSTIEHILLSHDIDRLAYKILKYLGDGKSHVNPPKEINEQLYITTCFSLCEQGLVDKPKHKMDVYRTSYKGQILLAKIEDEVEHPQTTKSTDNTELLEENDSLRREIKNKDKEIGDLQQQLAECKLMEHLDYSYEASKGQWETLHLTLREYIVISYAIYKKAFEITSGNLTSGLRCLICDKDTVTKYLRDSKLGGVKPLKEKEKEHIRKVCNQEGIDVTLISDYLN